jgi:hypothetical protein
MNNSADCEMDINDIKTHSPSPPLTMPLLERAYTFPRDPVCQKPHHTPQHKPHTQGILPKSPHITPSLTVPASTRTLIKMFDSTIPKYLQYSLDEEEDMELESQAIMAMRRNQMGLIRYDTTLILYKLVIIVLLIVATWLMPVACYKLKDFYD